MGAIVGIDLSVQTLDLISFVDQLVVLGFSFNMLPYLST